MKNLLCLVAFLSQIVVASEGWHPPTKYTGPIYDCDQTKGAALFGSSTLTIQTDGEADNYYNVIHVETKSGKNAKAIGRIKHAGPCPTIAGYKCHFGYYELSKKENYFSYFNDDLVSGKKEAGLIVTFNERDENGYLTGKVEEAYYRCEKK